jgi:hypothetical protein
LQGITLSRVRRSADIDFWFYQIDFFGYSAADAWRTLRKAVLLPDGSLLSRRVDGGAPPRFQRQLRHRRCRPQRLQIPSGLARASPFHARFAR